MTHLRILALPLLLAVLTGCQVELDTGSQDQSQGSSDTSTSSTGTAAADTDTTSNDSGVLSVSLQWSPPYERVNGSPLSHDDIGGYEIRYRSTDSDSYTVVMIDDPVTQRYYFDDLSSDGDYIFKVAVFDRNGLYSEFVTATP
ncbi:MAG: fibronectin type III domain-containing protein [Natronospirillum sp.]|uniref:fibronectin type III domain-containing protein n=1 Tax=Natronospirillum sp. TaxID=2812955 RepID=UPI0025E66A59|nr:fibronectin type III domain-containing protein [Natronospirillum sp.]MCH8551550.1 fibronectin type III domain-containing protein [Natronospirillum sp.]